MARIIKAKIDGKCTEFLIFQKPKELWKNYHVTKHVILNNNNEKYDSVLKIDTDEIEKIKSTQIDKLNCNVDQNTLQKDSCNQCTFTEECNTILEPIIKKYINMITQSVKEDNNKRTHAHYEKKRSSKSKSFMKKLHIIDKYGSSIISRKQNKFYNIMTCYRIAEFRNLKGIELGLKKLMSDFDFIKKMNIFNWNTRLNYREFQNVVKHAPDNWGY